MRTPTSTPKKIATYLQQCAEHICDETERLLRDEDDWVSHGASGGVEIYRKDVPDLPPIFRGHFDSDEGEGGVTLPVLFDFLADLSQRESYEQQCDEVEVLDQDEGNYLISYQSYRGQFGVQGRDFVLCGYGREVSDNIRIIGGGGIPCLAPCKKLHGAVRESPTAEEMEDYVTSLMGAVDDGKLLERVEKRQRGFAYIGSFALSRIAPPAGSSRAPILRISAVSQTELGGLLPSAIQKLVTTSHITSLPKILKQLKANLEDDEGASEEDESADGIEGDGVISGAAGSHTTKAEDEDDEDESNGAEALKDDPASPVRTLIDAVKNEPSSLMRSRFEEAVSLLKRIRKTGKREIIGGVVAHSMSSFLGDSGPASAATAYSGEMVCDGIPFSKLTDTINMKGEKLKALDPDLSDVKTLKEWGGANASLLSLEWKGGRQAIVIASEVRASSNGCVGLLLRDCDAEFTKSLPEDVAKMMTDHTPRDHQRVTMTAWMYYVSCQKGIPTIHVLHALDNGAFETARGLTCRQHHRNVIAQLFKLKTALRA